MSFVDDISPLTHCAQETTFVLDKLEEMRRSIRNFSPYRDIFELERVQRYATHNAIAIQQRRTASATGSASATDLAKLCIGSLGEETASRDAAN